MKSRSVGSSDLSLSSIAVFAARKVFAQIRVTFISFPFSLFPAVKRIVSSIIPKINDFCKIKRALNKKSLKFFVFCATINL